VVAEQRYPVRGNRNVSKLVVVQYRVTRMAFHQYHARD
jgi:hypothetical protein